MTSFAVEPFEITSRDGWVLRGDWVVPETPRAVALVGHAMMVDRRTLDRPRGAGLVSRLCARGIAVGWLDLRGHGQSGPRAHEGGRWTYDDLVADVAPVLDAARARFPGLPLAAVGHSLFSHVTLAYLCRAPETQLDALVMIAGNVYHPERSARVVGEAAAIRLVGLACRLVGRLPSRRLGIGSDDEASGYVDDFARWWASGDWAARDGFSYARARSSVKTPILALVGAGDKLMSPERDVRGLLGPVASATVRVVGRASGLPFDPGHMGLVLDERARPVWDEAADYILAL
jgi:predicted alpha/beta hydrolase